MLFSATNIFIFYFLAEEITSSHRISNIPNPNLTNNNQSAPAPQSMTTPLYYAQRSNPTYLEQRHTGGQVINQQRPHNKQGRPTQQPSAVSNVYMPRNPAHNRQPGYYFQSQTQLASMQSLMPIIPIQPNHMNCPPFAICSPNAPPPEFVKMSFVPFNSHQPGYSEQVYEPLPYMYQPEHVEQVYVSELPPDYCENMNNSQMYSHYCGKCGNECFANSQPTNQHENADCTAEKTEDVPTLTENRQLNSDELLELVISSLNKLERPVEYVITYKALTSTTCQFDDNFSNFYIFDYTPLIITSTVPIALPVDIFLGFLMSNKKLAEFILRQASAQKIPITRELLNGTSHLDPGVESFTFKAFSCQLSKSYSEFMTFNQDRCREAWFNIYDNFLHLVKRELVTNESSHPLFLRLVPEKDLRGSCKSNLLTTPSSSIDACQESLQPENKEVNDDSDRRNLETQHSQEDVGAVTQTISLRELIEKKRVINLFMNCSTANSIARIAAVSALYGNVRYNIEGINADCIFIDNSFLIAKFRTQTENVAQTNKLVIDDAELVIETEMKLDTKVFKLTSFVYYEIIDNPLLDFKLYVRTSKDKWKCMCWLEQSDIDSIDHLLMNTANVLAMSYERV